MFKTHVINDFMNVLQQFSSKNAFCIDEVFYSYSDLANRITSISKSIRKT